MRWAGCLLLLAALVVLLGCLLWKRVAGLLRQRALRRAREDAGDAGTYLLLRNYQPDGGFFWQMYNLLCAAHVAETYGLQLVVLFNTGPYLETQASFLERHADQIRHCAGNWFHYYFEGLAESSQPAVRQQIAEDPQAFIEAATPLLLSEQHVPDVEYGRGRVYEWCRPAFDRRETAFDFARMWSTYARPREHIQAKVDQFVARHMTEPGGCRMVGIHFRGTDKYGSSNDNEDDPAHYEYEWCAQTVRQHVRALQQGSPASTAVKILVCSDEQPFIDFMAQQFPSGVLVYTNAIRAPVNTGGQHLDSQSCADNDARPQCVTYRDMRYRSVHLGMPHESSYQKGEDVLIDVLLLSKCDVFLKSRGNVSNFPGYINPQLVVVDMADAYRRETGRRGD